jgi:RimJ/RimL family protein N-acetyltransferase
VTTPAEQHVQDLGAVRWPVRTQRLELRPVTVADVEATWHYRRLPEVYEWLPRAGQDRDEYVAAMTTPDRMAKTLAILLDGRVIGDAMLAVEDGWAQVEVADRARGCQAELGYALDPAHSGRGYATEAVAELLRVCFEELGVRRVIAQCFSDNEPSWRLMERLGMRRELHSVKESLHRTRGWVDGYMYALLAEEWRARRGA